MALLNLINRRTAGLILPKLLSNFGGITSQEAKCSSSTKDVLKHSEESQDDYPVPDLENPFQKEKQVCILCKMNITPDYKNPKLLSQFVSMYTGKIYGRHITGLCKKRQEQVEAEIIKSQNAGMMPYYLKDPAFMQDPQLFNPDTPFRNHPY